jgi:hypothetical protein
MTDFTINLDIVCEDCGENLETKQRAFKIIVTPCECTSPLHD